MTTTAIGAVARVIAFLGLLVLTMPPAGAQTGLVDLNAAPESELQKLPHMTPAIAKGLPGILSELQRAASADSS